MPAVALNEDVQVGVSKTLLTGRQRFDLRVLERRVKAMRGLAESLLDTFSKRLSAFKPAGFVLG